MMTTTQSKTWVGKQWTEAFEQAVGMQKCSFGLRGTVSPQLDTGGEFPRKICVFCFARTSRNTKKMQPITSGVKTKSNKSVVLY